jgi:hypothetical protein
MIPQKIFLAVVGLLYLALAIWCSIDPKTTSEKIGFELQPGSGQSEFVTVYGGLELGMALIFFLPLAWKESTKFALTGCLLMHASLVLFRTLAYFRFEGIDSFTHRLAIGEWVILLASIAFLLTLRPPPPQT